MGGALTPALSRSRPTSRQNRGGLSSTMLWRCALNAQTKWTLRQRLKANGFSAFDSGRLAQGSAESAEARSSFGGLKASPLKRTWRTIWLSETGKKSSEISAVTTASLTCN